METAGPQAGFLNLIFINFKERRWSPVSEKTCPNPRCQNYGKTCQCKKECNCEKKKEKKDGKK
ncbi:hypothetical protein C4569_03160 [Candidatus Parcubacteria bacterium]|nr:MAG: hypothetical protein C4569_03160 [Candidatus Parcubacteria bacterium]